MSAVPPAPRRQRLAWLRRRLLWSVVLLVIALGGAGLASAVDRPHTQEERPELGWSADRRAEPWLGELRAGLQQVEEHLAGLSGAGRQTLGALSTLEAGSLEQGLLALEANVKAGDTFADELSGALARVEQLRDQQPAGTQSWRLGEAARQLLARVDAAIAACRSLAGRWDEMKRVAQSGAGLIAAVLRHDEHVLAAMAAGREARWSDALAAIDLALAQLGQAEQAAAGFSTAPDGQTNELLSRLRTHDEALHDLYTLLEQTDSLEDPRVEPLRRRVEAARLPLPTPAATLRMVAAEVSLPVLSGGLVEFEQARGAVADALHPGDEQGDGE